MANRAMLQVVNLGRSSGGLSTVGYTLYNPDGTQNRARSTSGVIEIGTSTGIYGAMITFDVTSNLIILWDSGQASPLYATSPLASTIGQIQEETDTIRLIWNSLRNQGELYLKIIEKFNAMPNAATFDLRPIISRADKVLKVLDKIDSKENLTLKDVQDSLNISIESPKIPPPIVHVPEVKIPDYSKDIKAIGNAVGILLEMVGKIPIKVESYAESFTALIASLQTLQEKFEKDITTASSLNDKGLSDLNVGVIKARDDISSKLDDLVSESKSSLKDVLETLSHSNESIKDLTKRLIQDLTLLELSFTEKVKSGYREAVRENRESILNDKIERKNRNIKIGLGING